MVSSISEIEIYVQTPPPLLPMEEDSRVCKTTTANRKHRCSADLLALFQCRSIPLVKSLKASITQPNPGEAQKTLYKQEGRRVQLARMIYFVALRRCLSRVSRLKAVPWTYEQTLSGHSYPWPSSIRQKPSSCRECISWGFRGIQTGPRSANRQELHRVCGKFVPEWLHSIQFLSPCLRRYTRNPRLDRSYVQTDHAGWDQLCFPRPLLVYGIVRIESKLTVSSDFMSSTYPGSVDWFGPTLKRPAPFASSPGLEH